jgi:hypothetical protein
MPANINLIRRTLCSNSWIAERVALYGTGRPLAVVASHPAKAHGKYPLSGGGVTPMCARGVTPLWTGGAEPALITQLK